MFKPLLWLSIPALVAACVVVSLLLSARNPFRNPPNLALSRIGQNVACSSEGKDVWWAARSDGMCYSEDKP